MQNPLLAQKNINKQRKSQDDTSLNKPLHTMQKISMTCTNNLLLKESASSIKKQLKLKPDEDNNDVEVVKTIQHPK